MMTPELTVLTLAALLWVVQFAIYLIAGHGKIDLSAAMGPRDTDLERPVVCGRLHRALSNHAEGLVLFVIAIFVLDASGQSSSFTAACAYVYLIARILYVPAYAFGWTPGRTLIWMAGFTATTAMLLAALF